jgi:pimeloyl-[acyl-carrier protein] synthase
MTGSGVTSYAKKTAAELSLFRLLDPKILADPYPLYHRLRREDPVHWDPFLHSWVVTRYADVVRVLRDFSAQRAPTAEQLTALGLEMLNPVAKVMVKQMLFLDPPEHARIRGLASAAFTPQRVGALRAHIREIVRDLLARVRRKGSIDVIADLAEPVPCIVSAEMLGVPVEDHYQLKLWSQDFAEVLGNFQHNPDRAPKILKTTEEMTAYFRSSMRTQNLRPDGLVSSLMNAEIDGERLTEDEVIANSIITMVGAQETTTNLIGNGTLSLLRNPDELEKLRADLSLIPAAVEELLRYESPSQHTARLAPENIELGGKPIRKRQVVRAVMAAANRDPERFPDPDRLDISRQDNRHVAFGYGAHFCFGAPLARLEGQIAFEEMIRELPNWSLEGGPLVWRTNLGLRGLTSLRMNFTRKATENRVKHTKRGSTSSNNSTAERVPTMRDLSDAKRLLLKKYLCGDLLKTADDSFRIRRRPLDQPAPLSLTQEQIWLRAQKSADLPPFYNDSIIIHRHGTLDPRVVERSFTEIIRRHEAWRTTFDTVDGQPVQVIHPPPAAVPLPLVSLQEIPSLEREAEALRLATEDARKPFDLKKGPLVRAKLITLTENEHWLPLTMHQSVTDGVTVNTVFPTELATLCEAFSAGKPSPLADLPIQHADYAYWQRQWMQTEAFASQLAYWRERLMPEPPALRWPADPPRSASSTYRGAILPFTIPNQLVEKLNSMSRGESVTLFMSLLAGFSALLYRYTDQEDMVIGTLAPSGRKRSEVQNLMGYFLNPVPLRMNLCGNPTFRELLRRARDVVLGAIANDDVPFEYMLAKAGLSSNRDRRPLFEVVVSLAPAAPDLGTGWSQTFMDVESGGARWGLYLELGERPNGLLGRAQYNPDVFEATTIGRTLQEWQVLLEAAASNPELRLSELPC